jgi:hypothetical protein
MKIRQETSVEAAFLGVLARFHIFSNFPPPPPCLSLHPHPHLLSFPSAYASPSN